MLQKEKYVRRPFYVTSVTVTTANMEEVAKWCGGEVLTEKQKGRHVKYIKVPVARPMSEKQTKAYVKDRVLQAETGFKVYTEDAFQKCFQPVRLTETTDVMDEFFEPGIKGQEPLFMIVDEVTAREVCGKTKYTIDHKPCLLDKDHGKRPCTSIELGPARQDNQIFPQVTEVEASIADKDEFHAKFPKGYPKPSSR